MITEKIVDVHGDYIDLACVNCGEGSSAKLTFRGVVIYICWDCMGEIFDALHKERVL